MEGGLTQGHIGHMGRKAVGCSSLVLERCVYESKNSQSPGSHRSRRSPVILPWTAANLIPRFLVPGCKRCGGEPLYPGAVGESHSIPEQWGRATVSWVVEESHCTREL